MLGKRSNSQAIESGYLGWKTLILWPDLSWVIATAVTCLRRKVKKMSLPFRPDHTRVVLWCFTRKKEMQKRGIHIYIYIHTLWEIHSSKRKKEKGSGSRNWERGRAEEESSYRPWLPGSCCFPYKERCGREEDEVSPLLFGGFKARDSQFPNRTASFSCSGLESNLWVPEWQLDLCFLLIEGQK